MISFNKRGKNIPISENNVLLLFSICKLGFVNQEQLSLLYSIYQRYPSQIPFSILSKWTGYSGLLLKQSKSATKGLSKKPGAIYRPTKKCRELLHSLGYPVALASSTQINSHNEQAIQVVVQSLYRLCFKTDSFPLDQPYFFRDKYSVFKKPEELIRYKKPDNKPEELTGSIQSNTSATISTQSEGNLRIQPEGSDFSNYDLLSSTIDMDASEDILSSERHTDKDIAGLITKFYASLIDGQLPNKGFNKLLKEYSLLSTPTNNAWGLLTPLMTIDKGGNGTNTSSFSFESNLKNYISSLGIGTSPRLLLPLHLAFFSINKECIDKGATLSATSKEPDNSDKSDLSLGNSGLSNDEIQYEKPKKSTYKLPPELDIIASIHSSDSGDADDDDTKDTEDVPDESTNGVDPIFGTFALDTSKKDISASGSSDHLVTNLDSASISSDHMSTHMDSDNTPQKRQTINSSDSNTYLGDVNGQNPLSRDTCYFHSSFFKLLPKLDVNENWNFKWGKNTTAISSTSDLSSTFICKIALANLAYGYPISETEDKKYRYPIYRFSNTGRNLNLISNPEFNLKDLDLSSYTNREKNVDPSAAIFKPDEVIRFSRAGVKHEIFIEHDNRTESNLTQAQKFLNYLNYAFNHPKNQILVVFSVTDGSLATNKYKQYGDVSRKLGTLSEKLLRSYVTDKANNKLYINGFYEKAKNLKVVLSGVAEADHDIAEFINGTNYTLSYLRNINNYVKQIDEKTDWYVHFKPSKEFSELLNNPDLASLSISHLAEKDINPIESSKGNGIWAYVHSQSKKPLLGKLIFNYRASLDKFEQPVIAGEEHSIGTVFNTYKEIELSTRTEQRPPLVIYPERERQLSAISITAFRNKFDWIKNWNPNQPYYVQPVYSANENWQLHKELRWLTIQYDQVIYNYFKFGSIAKFKPETAAKSYFTPSFVPLLKAGFRTYQRPYEKLHELAQSMDKATFIDQLKLNEIPIDLYRSLIERWKNSTAIVPSIFIPKYLEDEIDKDDISLEEKDILDFVYAPNTLKPSARLKISIE